LKRRSELVLKVLGEVGPISNETLKDKHERLRNLLREYENDSWGWAFAVVAVELCTSQLFQLDDQPDASRIEQLLQTAVEKLEQNSWEEIPWRKVHLLLAMALRFQGKMRESLEAAQRAVAFNPQDPQERNELAEAYLRLTVYDQAEDELLKSIELDPSDDNSVAIAKLADCRLGRARESRDTSYLRQAQRRSVEGLINVLELWEGSPSAGQLHYEIGNLQLDLREFGEAVYHLRAASRLDAAPLESRLTSGVANLFQGAYDQAEACFRDAAAEAMRQLRKLRSAKLGSAVGATRSLSDLLHSPANALGEERPINDILLRVYLYQIIVCVDRGRDVKRARRYLGYAHSRLEHVRARRCYLSGRVPARAWSTDPQTLREHEAFYLACNGWVSYAAGNNTDAMRSLEQSVMMVSGRGLSSYMLACVYLDEAQVEKAQREQLLQSAREACNECRSVDLWGQFSSRVDKVEKRIAELTAR
jgi:tetratricopeptide (TPR) repeat protein